MKYSSPLICFSCILFHGALPWTKFQDQIWDAGVVLQTSLGKNILATKQQSIQQQLQWQEWWDHYWDPGPEGLISPIKYKLEWIHNLTACYFGWPWRQTFVWYLKKTFLFIFIYEPSFLLHTMHDNTNRWNISGLKVRS